MILKQPVILDDTDIADTDDPFDKKIFQDDSAFQPVFSLLDIPSTSEKDIDSEDESLQLEKFHETYPSIMKH